jgi:phospholipase C
LKNKPTGNMIIIITNEDTSKSFTAQINDNAYGNKSIIKELAAAGKQDIILPLTKSFGWYDFSIRITGINNFEKRYAGRVETGKESFSDPFMGKL